MKIDRGSDTFYNNEFDKKKKKRNEELIWFTNKS